MAQLLLTAAPDVQEWHELVEGCEAELNGWIESELSRELRESYMTVRDEFGSYHNVTHWTRDCMDDDDISDRLYYRIEEYVGHQLGRGHFSTVFKCPWDETKAIKVGYGPGGECEIWEDGWLAYASFCMNYAEKHGYNPILPDIHKLHISDEHTFYIALMDRYDTQWGNIAYCAGKDLQERYMAIRAIKGKEYESKDADKEYLKYARDIRNHPAFPGMNDLHSGNVMVMDDCRVILTDPAGLSNRKGRHETKARLARLGILPEEYIREAEEINKENDRSTKRWIKQTRLENTPNLPKLALVNADGQAEFIDPDMPTLNEFDRAWIDAVDAIPVRPGKLEWKPVFNPVNINKRFDWRKYQKNKVIKAA